jgi:hypothetical protein
MDGVKCVAHRLSYIVFIGHIPEDKPHVCHRCDVRRCINPDHLFAGTPHDNRIDAAVKGRLRRPSVLTPRLDEVKQLLLAGLYPKAIGRVLGVSRGVVRNFIDLHNLGELLSGDICAQRRGRFHYKHAGSDRDCKPDPHRDTPASGPASTNAGG